MRRGLTVALCILLVAAACDSSSTESTTTTDNGEISTEADTSSTSMGATGTTTGPGTTSTTVLESTTTTTSPIVHEEPGQFCRDLAAKGYSYSEAVWYWENEGQPERMDADRNGIPCETVFDAVEVRAHWGDAVPVSVVPAGNVQFAGALDDVPLVTSGTYGGPAWPVSLADVVYLEEIPGGLHDRLLDLGFVIEQNDRAYLDEDDMSWATHWSAPYNRLSPYAGRAVFVTTDVAYHLWHQVFDMVLRETEQFELLPTLEGLVVGLVNSARVQAQSLEGGSSHEPAMRAQEHLEAVATVLELDVGAIGERAAAEVSLVEQASELTASPTVGSACPPTCIDYSLTRPRGHYTRTDELQRYFRGMSMLGNTGFTVADTEALQVGLMVTRLIVTDETLAEAWNTIYHPTAFLVGTADDYTPFEAATAAEQVVAGGLASAEVLGDTATVEAIAAELLEMRAVQIDPAKASLRTMGARFVLDSWIYDRLTDPGVAGRIRPTPLDLASVMGSSYAAGVQTDAGVGDEFPAYAAQIGALRSDIANRTVDDWGQTVYAAWLWTLEPLWADRYDEAFPPFMQSDAWDAKSHNTGFSSYTELKHDTILYAKQGVAEGEAPEPPPPPRHWVEPDPVAFGRLGAIAELMRDGLVEAGLMLGGSYDTAEGNSWVQEERGRYFIEWFIEIVEWLEGLAADELAGEPISAEDNERLSWFGGELDHFIQSIWYGELEPTPLVADIFLDPFADEILEVATGPQDLIHVLVPNDDGQFQVATGAVYSYREFWGPRSERLTDEEWWAQIVAGDIPERPMWWLNELG